jgi:hypothetical protein
VSLPFDCRAFFWVGTWNEYLWACYEPIAASNFQKKS